MHLIFLVLLVIAALFAQGCETPQAPSQPHEAWTAPSEAAAPRAGERTAAAYDPAWASIRQIEIDTSKPLALAELIDIALRNNPQLQQAWENARAAEAQVTQAKSQLYPQANVNGAVSYQKLISNRVYGDTEEVIYNPSLSLTYLLLDLGGRGAAITGAIQALFSANFQFNQKLQDLILGVTTAFYQLDSAQASVQALGLSLKDTQKSCELAQKRFEAGLVTRLDVLQTKSSYISTRYSLEDAGGQAAVAEANLAQATGLPADREFTISPLPDKLPTLVSEENVSKLIEEALGKRPDLASLRANLRAREAEVKAAGSDLWPTLNAGGQLNWNWYDYLEETLPLSTREQQYTGYLSLGWNLFDGFNNLARKRASRARARAARQELADAELGASADVWSSYYLFKSAAAKLATSEEYLLNSQATLDLAYECYEAGLADIFYLLQAQAVLTQARVQLISAKEDLLVSLANLAHATGSLSPPEPERKAGPNAGGQ